MQVAPVIAVNIPTTVEAWHWDGSAEQAERIIDWITDNDGFSDVRQPAALHPYDNVIVLGDGYDCVSPGQWVIRDKFGDFFPLRDTDYRATFQSPVLR